MGWRLVTGAGEQGLDQVGARGGQFLDMLRRQSPLGYGLRQDVLAIGRTQTFLGVVRGIAPVVHLVRLEIHQLAVFPGQGRGEGVAGGLRVAQILNVVTGRDDGTASENGHRGQYSVNP